MARVRVEGLTKKFGDVVAVDHISFEARNGEFVCLLGPSGCGKTTTLSCIAGLESPYEGEIYIDDVRIDDLTPAQRDIAMVFQSYALYPFMTVYDNISFPLKMRKVPKDEIKTRVREVAEMLHISHLMRRLPARLSGGEAQRVAICRAIVRGPKLYLMDEPLTNLDAKLRVLMRVELKRLREEMGQTTIYATPDWTEALSLSDRVAVMGHGVVQQFDTAANVYDHPKSLFVAGFIGSPPMNFIDCSFVKKDGKAFLDAGTFSVDISDLSDLIEDQLTSPEVILGIRPSDVRVSKERTREALEAEVTITEPVGLETILHLKVRGKMLNAKVPPTIKASPGDKLWVVLDKRQIHIFDKRTEKAIV